MKPDQFKIADPVSVENKPENSTEFTDAEINDVIRKIAESKFQMTLNDKELEKARIKIKAILQYEGTNKGNCDQTGLEKKAEAYLKKVKDIKEFIKAYFAARTLYEQLNPEGEFYFLNPDNPEKLMSYIYDSKETVKDPKTFFILVAGRFNKIKDIIGTSGGSKKVFMADTSLNGPSIEEIEIISVQKDGCVRLAGRGGSFAPFDMYKTKEEAEKHIEEHKNR